MASSLEHMDSRTGGGKPPITASPAFPWVVALWFAALLGVGSLIVPVALIERVILASGLTSVLPQAAPPLGFTARALIAMAGTVFGALLGFSLARRITAEKPAKVARPAPRRVLSAHEDLGEDGLDAQPAAPPARTRRRALALAEEERQSDFLNTVPLPGEVVFVDVEAGEAEEPAAEPVPQSVEPPLQVAQALELDASTELTEAQEVEAQTATAYFEDEQLEHTAQPEPPAEAAAPEIEPLAFSPPSMARVPEPEGERLENDDSEYADTRLEEPGIFAPNYEDDVADKQFFEGPDAEGPSEAEELCEDFGADDAEPVQDHEASDTGAAETGAESGEGLVQLVQRLGATMQKHREWSMERAAAQPAPLAAAPEAASQAPLPEEFDPAAADDAAEAMAAWFGKSADSQPQDEPVAEVEDAPVEAADPAPVEHEQAAPPYASFPAELPESDDEDDAEFAELAASFSLPLASKAEAAPAADAEDEDGDEEDAAEEQHASLASLNPFKQQDQEFVRIEEPEPEAGHAEPAVLFPGQQEREPVAEAPAKRAFDPPAGKAMQAPASASRPRPSNDDNERALREALMNLQRMSR